MTLEPGTTVTVDTNMLPVEDLLAGAAGLNLHIAVASVTGREVGHDDPRISRDCLGTVTETAVWGDTAWGEGHWGDRESHESLELAISIISDGSFPKDRDDLTAAQRRQLRDAMIFATHCREGRCIFVTNDKKAFVSHEKREKLEVAFGTRILTGSEFRGLL